MQTKGTSQAVLKIHCHIKTPQKHNFLLNIFSGFNAINKAVISEHTNMYY